MNSPITNLRSIHTTNFPNILSQLGISLVVSTYQAGKVILLRADNRVVNTHFCDFDKPMGMTASGDKLAIGTTYRVWELRNTPAVAPKLEPAGKHDACFMPREMHITGDIDIHEMAYAKDTLWFINTRFSCLCTMEERSRSFVPRWRPPFVTAYDLGDRCHLNGLGMRDGEPRYVTALGHSDSRDGWRENKARGGVLMDITTNRIISRGLSMPHSPRWYGQQLWVLESGEGSLAKVDLETGQLTKVVELPGFTRGIDFWGPFAFIGLSQVRETAVFSGIPITERLQERTCGVWVVNIHTGEIVAFLKFEDAVQEIFSVVVLPGVRYPGLVDSDPKLLSSSYVLPDEALRELALPETPAMKMPESKPPVDSFAVVMPVFNLSRRGKKEAVLAAALASVEASLDYFNEHYPGADKFTYEVVLVDDTANARVWKTLQKLTEGKPFYKLVRHETNRGQAAARNTGVRACKAKALFFCDDDDLFFRPHLCESIKILNQPLGANVQPLISMTGGYPGAVRTRAEFSTPIHPEWKNLVSNLLPITLGVRREAYEFVGGFPEEEVFRQSFYGQEDWAFSQLLQNFFAVVILNQDTVKHIAYPGNAFHFQIPKFQVAPGEFPEDEYEKLPDPEQQREYTRQIQQIVQQQRLALYQKQRNRQESDRLFNLGNEAVGQKNYAMAVSFYQQCLQLTPDYPLGHYNLGVAYMKSEQWSQAKAAFEQTLVEDPSYPQAHNNLGLVYHAQNDMDKAIENYRNCIHYAPDLADPHLNLSLALLSKGDFAEGLKEYEWRTKTEQVPGFTCEHPRWDGTEQPDKTLMIHTEQGSGDAMQFIRYIPLVKERSRCRSLVLICHPDLQALFATVPGIDRIRLPGEIPLNEFDTYISLMSVPLVLGANLDNIPQSIPYLKVPENQTFGELPPPLTNPCTLKVGIVWAGNPDHPDNSSRSCALTDFLPLFQIPGVNFYSLQKRVTLIDQAQLRDFRVQDLSPRLTTFAETAGAIAQLDLVISVDTSVVHLAGALGKPTWTLLRYSPDWRWLMDRDDTPWYPTMRLFRQTKPREWGEVFERVAQQLSTQNLQHLLQPV